MIRDCLLLNFNFSRIISLIFAETVKMKIEFVMITAVVFDAFRIDSNKSSDNVFSKLAELSYVHTILVIMVFIYI